MSQTNQYSIAQSVILHLLPGTLIIATHVITAPLVIEFGFPSELSLLLSFIFIGIPVELGYLFIQGKKINRKLSLKGVIQYRNKMSVWKYGLLFILLLVAALGALFLTTSLTSYLAGSVFNWLPEYLRPHDLAEAAFSRSAIILVLVLRLIIDGFINPIVEELYFRGHLLPNMSHMAWVAPLLNATLFTIAHFWQPYNYPLILLIQIPVVFVVYVNKNIYIAILVHCFANILGALLTLLQFINQ